MITVLIVINQANGNVNSLANILADAKNQEKA